MNKKVIGFIMTGLMTVGVGMAAQQPQAHAAGYKWVKTKNYKNIPWHNKSNKTAYMYNWNHTKKLHNLKKYPTTTWYVSKSIKMVKGNKSGVFYKVTSGNKKVSGYVYRGYLVKGKYQASNESNYIDIIRDTFKGTKYDKNREAYMLQFDQYYATPEEPEYYFDNPPKITDPCTPEEQANIIHIDNLPTSDDMRALGTNKITFKRYLLDTLKKQNIDPNAYNGYNISIAAWYKGKPSGYYEKGYYQIDLYK